MVADNRHYIFYVWKYYFERFQWLPVSLSWVYYLAIKYLFSFQNQVNI